MDRRIQLINQHNLPEALQLIWDVFQEFESPDYSDEGITEFRKTIDMEVISNRISSGEWVMKGYFEGSDLTGVIAVRGTTHISLLFVRKEHHRKGIARQLLESVVDDGRKAGYSEFTVNSSPYAVEAYHRLGFSDTDREQVVNGIRFTPMKLQINTE